MLINPNPYYIHLILPALLTTVFVGILVFVIFSPTPVLVERTEEDAETNSLAEPATPWWLWVVDGRPHYTRFTNARQIAPAICMGDVGENW